MNWSQQAPTQSGWYWFDEGDQHPVIVLIDYLYGNVLFAYTTGTEEPMTLAEFQGQWYGPLTPPPLS